MNTTLDKTWASDALEHVLANAMTATPQSVDQGVNEEANKIAHDLGLARQAMRHTKVSEGIHTAFDDNRLAGEELGVWQVYCPTRYVEGTPEFSLYSFDSIPLPVLRYWKQLKAEYAFDRFEIWTVEKPRRTADSDPLLIGMYENVAFLLARWGKEAKDLLPYHEVRERVKVMMHRNFDVTKLPEKVASTIRILQEKNIFEEVWPAYRMNEGHFFYRKHCGKRLMAFATSGFSGDPKGICQVCGVAQNIKWHLLYEF